MTSLGFVTPTPIQASTVPVALLGKDICACAATGTGKGCRMTWYWVVSVYLTIAQLYFHINHELFGYSMRDSLKRTSLRTV